jgi:hypothetical protein
MADWPPLPEPRSFAGTAIWLGGITALPFAIVWSLLVAIQQQRPLGEILPYGLGAGLFFGAAFGPAMAFFFRGETADVRVPDKQDFLSRLNIATSQLGYNPATESEDFLTYKPSMQAGLAAGRISVQLRGGRAVIIGPKLYVRKLIGRLASEL